MDTTGPIVTPPTPPAGVIPRRRPVARPCSLQEQVIAAAIVAISAPAAAFVAGLAWHVWTI